MGTSALHDIYANDIGIDEIRARAQVDAMARFIPEPDADCEEMFKAAEAYLAWNYQFYFEFIIRIQRYPNPKMDAMMGVRVSKGRLYLVYNPELMLKELSGRPEMLRFVLMHELSHVALGHCTHMNLSDLDGQHVRANYAHDLAINSDHRRLLRENRFVQLITHRDGSDYCLLPEQFHTKDGKVFQDCQSSAWYYEALGDYVSDKIPDAEDFDSHAEWADDENAAAFIAGVVEYVKSSNKWGGVSARFKELVLAAHAPQVPWDRLLHAELGNFGRRSKRHSWSMPHLVFNNLSQGKVSSKTVPTLVVQDTSGSVGTKDLEICKCETDDLHKRTRSVFFCSFDTSVHQETPIPWPGVFDEFEYEGRGGTDISPVFARLNQDAGWHFSKVVIMTDGYLSFPEYLTPGVKFIWIITKDGTLPPYPESVDNIYIQIN